MRAIAPKSFEKLMVWPRNEHRAASIHGGPRRYKISEVSNKVKVSIHRNLENASVQA